MVVHALVKSGYVGAALGTNHNDINYGYDASQRLTRQYEYWTNRTPLVRGDKKTAYDLAGRVTCQWMVGSTDGCNSTSPARVEYAYDAADRLTEEKQDGRAVNYAYDAAGNRTLIQWPDGKHADYQYTARNQLSLVSFEAVALAAYSYDIQGFDAVRRRRTKRIAFRAENAPSAGEGPERATGATFGNGNSAGVAHEVDDDLSLLAYALKDEAGAAQALEWTYTYTNAHRLLSQSVTLAAHDWSPPANVTTSYAAPSMAPGLPNEAANEVDQYEQIGESINGGAAQNSALSYDVRGNLTSDTVWTYTYDLENRMLTATASGTSCSSTCTYAYDPMGRRVSKTVGGTVTKFLRAGPAEIAEYDGSGSLLRRYVPGAGPDTFIVWIEGTGVTSSSMKWILADRQGSVAVVTDNNGKATQRFAYDPFGNETAGASGTGFPFRYTGQRFDPETGLYYYKARLYSAKLGRFLQTDPVGYEDQYNLYTYVENDPANKTDPDGKFLNIIIGAAAGAVVGAVIETGVQLATGKGSLKDRINNLDGEKIAQAAAVGAVSGAIGPAGGALLRAGLVGRGAAYGARATPTLRAVTDSAADLVGQPALGAIEAARNGDDPMRGFVGGLGAVLGGAAFDGVAALGGHNLSRAADGLRGALVSTGKSTGRELAKSGSQTVGSEGAKSQVPKQEDDTWKLRRR